MHIWFSHLEKHKLQKLVYESTLFILMKVQIYQSAMITEWYIILSQWNILSVHICMNLPEFQLIFGKLDEVNNTKNEKISYP